MVDRLTPTQAREALRAILGGTACVRPASVFDALTVRASAQLGFPLAMLGGSVAALAVLGAPDHQLLSLDEFAGLCRRICRPGALPLLVDADHGFGTALQARRCVEELEVAGVAGMTLEDTCLPRPFDADGPSLVPLAEARAKLDAALDARTDPAFVIVARTDARVQEVDALVERAAAYRGADALFVTGARDADVLAKVAKASGLPLIVPQPKGALADADLAELGVRICLTPHHTLRAAIGAAWDSLAVTPGAKQIQRPGDLMDLLSEREIWDTVIGRFMRR